MATTYQEIVIDKEGDVRLVLGPDTINEEDLCYYVQVSSKIMGLASSVFKTLLKPQFAEGNNLEQNGSVEIPLPDDEPAVMIDLCQVLHHMIDFEKAEKYTESSLYQLTILIDKYDCYRATSVWIQLCCSTSVCLNNHFTKNFSGIESTVPTLSRWIFILHVLKKEHVKGTLLHQLLTQITPESIHVEEFGRLPDKVHDALIKRREVIVTAALAALKDVIESQFLASRTSPSQYSTSEPVFDFVREIARIRTSRAKMEHLISNVLFYGSLVIGVQEHVCNDIHDLKSDLSITSLCSRLESIQTDVETLTEFLNFRALKIGLAQTQETPKGYHAKKAVLQPILDGIQSSLSASTEWEDEKQP